MPNFSQPNRIRASTICIDQGRLLVVYLKDPTTQKVLTCVPGGEIEAGEHPVAAAKRETLEETGYLIDVDESSEHVSIYPFVWDGQKRLCKTHYFLAKLVHADPESVDDATYNLGRDWLPLDQVHNAFSYHAKVQTDVTNLIAAVRSQKA